MLFFELHCRTLNQEGKTGQEMTANLLVARRPSAVHSLPGRTAVRNA